MLTRLSKDTVRKIRWSLFWSCLKGWTAPSRFCLGSAGSLLSQTSRICRSSLSVWFQETPYRFARRKAWLKEMGKNKVVVCGANFKVQKRSAWKATCALKKQSAFLFDRGIEKTQKVVQKVSNRKTFRSSVEHPQSFSRALGKHWPSLIRCTSALNIYIYIYVLYSLYICCFILTVAIASLTF